MSTKPNRRNFLLSSAAAAATATMAAAAGPEVRTAFIGVGHRGSRLLELTLAEENVRITAICDIDPQARDGALSKASRFNPKSITEWRQVLDLKDVDAVKIATPCYLHAEMAAACLEAGKYVYCEKPLGIQPEQVAHVLKAAKNAKTFLQIGQQLRYFPSVREVMRHLHEENILGKIFVIRAQRNSTPARPGTQTRQGSNMARMRPEWYEDVKRSGDLIVENAVHNIDCCNWMAQSRPESAYGHGKRYLPDPIPAGTLMMDGFDVEYIYQNDMHAQYTQLYLHPRAMKVVPNGQWYIIHGEKGAVFFTHDAATFYDMQGDSEPLELVPPKLQEAEDFAMTDFYGCIREKRQPFADVRVGAVAALTAIMGREAIYKRRMVSWKELGVEV
jgi:myo-inositol 2-dehydrogenase / D-chiro-inositol 1-dehydrogenase